MVKTLFYLRFRSQLRRTRPDLVKRLEKAAEQAFEDAGGKISGGRFCATAVYDDSGPGFWLDMLLLIETIQSALDREKFALFGYALLVGQDFTEAPEALCRFLAMGPQEGGVFVDAAARDALSPYLEFEKTAQWPGGEKPDSAGKRNVENIARLSNFKPIPSQTERVFPLRETIVKAIANSSRNTLITGPEFSGKRDGIYQYCHETMGNFPPLLVHFGTGGVNPLVQAWTALVRTAAAPIENVSNNRNTITEIESLSEFLFRERLREELAPFIIEKTRRFFSLVIELYIAAARHARATPVLMLENIHLAGNESAQIIIDVYSGAHNRQALTVLGTCAAAVDEAESKRWESVFPRMIKLKNETPPFRCAEIPRELWEIAYSLSLLARCFPPDLFPRLFAEEGKNPMVISRAFSLLCAYGVIDTPLDPRPRIPDFIPRAESALGEKKQLIRAMVLRRLLSWVEQKKLSPCFRLLTLIAELKSEKSFTDELILKSVYADLVAGTIRRIEEAQVSGVFDILFTGEKAAAVRYIYQTTRALLKGGKDEIRTAFLNPAPDCSSLPVLKAQILANEACAYLGRQDIKPALNSVKEAMQLSQNKNGFCLAQSYRLFSLINLSRGQPGETNNYLDFAMEHAEKSGNYHELGISAYYAAVSQFLFGNISKAMRLARTAREEALSSGHPGWADRACFLEGRLAFEIGRYREAYDIFETLRKNPAGGTSAEKDGVLAAWIYRARVFFQNPLTKKPDNGGHDADLFEVEAAYLANDFRRTVDLSGALSNPHDGEEFLFTEQPDWRSGFAQCELLYFSRGEIWDRLVCTYRSLALSRVRACEEATHSMQRILRDEQLSEMDPWNAFYFYAWYRILEQSGAGQVDMNTAVSIAFKRLQRRASRIDDIEIKRDFLTRPRWNSTLGLAAKEFRLI